MFSKKIDAINMEKSEYTFIAGEKNEYLKT
jgi:hypothetical protein